jgi:hypothetical protein
MRAVDNESGLDRLLTRLFRIDGGHEVADRHRGAAPTAGDHPRTRRRRIDSDTSGHFERLHELAHPHFVLGIDDEVHRVFAANNGLTLDLDAELAHVGTTEIVEESRTDVRIGGRTLVGGVLVADYEKSHT